MSLLSPIRETLSKNGTLIWGWTVLGMRGVRCGYIGPSLPRRLGNFAMSQNAPLAISFKRSHKC